MSLGTILVIFLLGGFSGRFGGYGYGFGHGGNGLIGFLLIIVVVLLLTGRLWPSGFRVKSFAPCAFDGRLRRYGAAHRASQ
jgi:Protein of unknown function (DUF3309)